MEDESDIFEYMLNCVLIVYGDTVKSKMSSAHDQHHSPGSCMEEKEFRRTKTHCSHVHKVPLVPWILL